MLKVRAGARKDSLAHGFAGPHSDLSDSHSYLKPPVTQKPYGQQTKQWIV